MVSWLKKYSPIFFDFDGLLVDTECLHFQAYKDTLQSRGIGCPWSFLQFAEKAHTSGRALQALVSTLIPEMANTTAMGSATCTEKKTL